MSDLFTIEDSNTLGGVADEILEKDTALSLRRSIGRILDCMNVPLTDRQREDPASFDRVALENFLVAFALIRNAPDALCAARHSSPRSG